MLRITGNSYVRLEQVRCIDIKENVYDNSSEYPHDISVEYVGGGYEVWSVDQNSVDDVKKQLQALTVFPTVSLEQDYEMPPWI